MAAPIVVFEKLMRDFADNDGLLVDLRADYTVCGVRGGPVLDSRRPTFEPRSVGPVQQLPMPWPTQGAQESAMMGS